MVKSMAAAVHVAPTGKNAKPPGQKGLAAALLAAAGKGVKKASLSASAASASKSGKLALPSFSEILKKGIAEATPKEAQPLLKKASDPGAAAQTSAAHAAISQVVMNAEKEPLGKDEKVDTKKKTVPAAQATTISLAAQMTRAAGKTDSAKSADSSSTAQKSDQAQQGAPAVASKAGVAQQSQPIVRIVDLRKKQAADSGDASAAANRSSTATSVDAKDQTVSFAQRLATASDPSSAAVDKPAASASTTAQTPLERLREMAGSELTQATTMILKDGGGEIRLVLKPESLGNVRIRMNVVDNKIEGTIIVDSAAVKHVFDGSIDALRRALTAEGFQTGSLSVSVGGQNADSGGRQQRQTPAEVQKIAAQGFERNVPGLENMSLGDLLVNVFV
jgi:flagellar protein FlbC